MNQSNKQKEVFQYLANSEPELSKAQVQAIIKRLPTLPVPKGGNPHTLGFNFNTIIMNSIIFISALSSILYFVTPEIKESPQAESFPVEQGIIAAEEEVLTYSEPQQDAALAQTRIEEKEDAPVQDFSENSGEEAPISSDDKIARPSIGQKQLNSLSTQKPQVISPSQNRDLANLDVPLSRAAQPTSTDVGKPISLRGKSYYDHLSPVKISKTQIQTLKKSLIKNLRQDRLMSKGNPQVQINYSLGQIQVNGKKLEEVSFTAYKALFESYGIGPGAKRQIRLIDKFILVGDFRQNGQLEKGIVEGSGSIRLTGLALEPNSTTDSSLFPSTDSGILSMREGPCKTELKIEGEIITLKEDLLEKLLADGLITSAKVKNRLWFPKEGMAINKTLLSQIQHMKYSLLLMQYNINPCPNRLIQMTGKYIAVGDIIDENFKGRMHGSINLDKLNRIKLSENFK